MARKQVAIACRLCSEELGSLPSCVDRRTSPAEGNRVHPKTGTQEVWDRFHREGFGLVACIRETLSQLLSLGFLLSV